MYFYHAKIVTSKRWVEFWMYCHVGRLGVLLFVTWHRHGQNPSHDIHS